MTPHMARDFQASMRGNDVSGSDFGSRVQLASSSGSSPGANWSQSGARTMDSPPLQPVTLVKNSSGRYALTEPPFSRSGGYSSANAVSTLPLSPIASDVGGSASSSSALQRGLAPTLRGAEPMATSANGLANETSLALHSRRETSPMDAASVERLRLKLQDTASTFAGLDRTVEDHAWKRKEMEQKKLQDISAYLAKLEKTLNVEISRRADAQRDLQTTLDQVLSNMVEHVQNAISVRFDSITHASEELTERCATLERGIQQFKGKLPSKLQMDSAALSREIKRLATELDANKKSVVEIDTNMQRRITESEYSLDFRVEQELTSLTRRSEALQELIEEFSSAGDIPDAKARRVAVFQSIQDVKAGLNEEAQDRERIDDQVVQAINDYTGTLHRSLCATNR